MVILLLIVFIVLCFLSFFEESLENYKLEITIPVLILLIVIATFRVIGNDDDSENYQLMFNNYDDQLTRLSTEPSFIMLSSFTHAIGQDIHFLFFLYAVIALPLKFMAIRQLSKLFIAPLMIFVSHFFLLHDMIEIRISAAIGFFMLSIKPICEGKKKTAFLLLLGAVFFHYSSLVLFALLFLSNKPLSSTWKWGLAAIVPLGYLAYFLNVDILTTIPIPVIGQKLELYKSIKEMGMFEEIYVFKNPTLLIKILCFYLLLCYNDMLREYNQYLPILTKIMGMSLFCFFFFSSLPVLSGRLYELFGAIDIITIALVGYTIVPQYLGKTIVALFSCIMIFMDLFIYELVRF